MTKFRRKSQTIPFLVKSPKISAESGVRLTYDDIRRRTVRAALNLQSRGYGRGHVFSFMARNSEHLAPAVLAALCMGCPVNAIATSQGKSETKHMLSIVRPSLVFCDGDVHAMLTECLQELQIDAKIITFDGKVGSSAQCEDLFVEADGEEFYV